MGWGDKRTHPCKQPLNILRQCQVGRFCRISLLLDRPSDTFRHVCIAGPPPMAPPASKHAGARILSARDAPPPQRSPSSTAIPAMFPAWPFVHRRRGVVSADRRPWTQDRPPTQRLAPFVRRWLRQLRAVFGPYTNSYSVGVRRVGLSAWLKQGRDIQCGGGRHLTHDRTCVTTCAVGQVLADGAQLRDCHDSSHAHVGPKQVHLACSDLKHGVAQVADVRAVQLPP